MKIGFARLDVTPPKGTCIASRYFYFVPAEGCLDALELNALAASDGENVAVIIAADFGGMTQKYMNLFRARVSERTGLPVEQIFITTLHQHTSIVVSDPAESDTPMCDPVVLEWLYRKFCDAAEIAIEDMSEATMLVGAEKTAEQITFIRRNDKVEDPTAPDGHRFVSYGPEPDQNVYVARFVREGKKDVALVNFGTHPDVVNEKSFSNDWLGATRRFVEGDMPQVHCMLLNGFQGDVNHFNYYTATAEERKLMRGHTHAAKMGRVIADTVEKMWENLVPCDAQFVKTQTDMVYTRTRTDGIERYDEAKAYCEAYKLDHHAKGPMGIAEAQRIVEIRESAPIYQKIPVCTIELGGLLIAGIGAEPFTKYGYAIRALAGDKALVMTACLMNGYECYMPHTDDFQKRDYAVTRSRFTPALFGETMAAFEGMLQNK
ncbi:MAG: hypothetical protein E7624_01775 [Ruminococcaceae bacterium]|nr:hypothetical protein [Oscillospiraceae bacterium]